MSPRPLLLAILTVVIAPMLARNARAELECPTASAPDDARRLAGESFSSGEQLYRAGDREAALARFRCSYQLLPHPSTLMNIAVVLEDLGRIGEALDEYRMYTRSFPNDSRRADVEAEIRRLEAELQPAQAAPAPPRATEPPPPEPPAASVPPAGQPRQPPDQHLRMSTPRIVSWVMLGLGLAAGAGGGVAYGLAARDNSDYLHQRDAELRPQDEIEELRQTGSMLEALGWGLFGTSAAMVATWLVVFLVFDGRAPAAAPRGSATVSVWPSMDRDGSFGWSLNGSF